MVFERENMCGFVGIIRCNDMPVERDTIQLMNDTIRHRGPDAEGIFVEQNIGLGHRRLSILDLSDKGKQPMFSNDGRYCIVYNGEIYNHLDLRRKLEAMGFAFKSTCDTETVLYAYIQWGCTCVNMFNGMFAFVIYDREQKTLFFARDRYGIKPLYYAFQNQSLYFASEQKAFLGLPEFSGGLDYEGLLEYFTFQNFFTEHTLEKHTKTFPAGMYCQISTLSLPDKLPLQRYWDFDFSEPLHPYDENEYIEELERLFRQAVKRQLMSDVPLGSYLSGGMDSGSITAVAAAQIPNLNTFTCGFDMHSVSGLEVGFDERVSAEYMSYLFKTEHYEMVLKAGDMERIFRSLVYHIEEPRVGQCYPNMYAAKLASKFCKVVLSGAGGDEMFGGYPWRYYRAAVNDGFDDYIGKYYRFWQRLIPNVQVKEVFQPIWGSMKHVWTQDIFRDVFINRSKVPCTPEEYINHSLYFEAKTFLHGLLTVEDKLSMAYSLESRVPFLDNDMVDFAMRVPVSYKLKNLQDVVRLNENDFGNKSSRYFQKTNDGKLIFRKAMARILPDSINNATKQGFSAPDATWFRGESIDFVRSMLYNPNAAIYNYMNYQSVKKLLDEHMSGQVNRRLLIWSLMSFETWLDVFGIR